MGGGNEGKRTKQKKIYQRRETESSIAFPLTMVAADKSHSLQASHQQQIVKSILKDC